MTNSYKLLPIWNPKQQLNGLQSMILLSFCIANYFHVSQLISLSNGRNKKSIIKLKTSLIKRRQIFIMIILTENLTVKQMRLKTTLRRRRQRCQDRYRHSKREGAKDQMVSTEERLRILQRRPQVSQTPHHWQERHKKWLREGKLHQGKTYLSILGSLMELMGVQSQMRQKIVKGIEKKQIWQKMVHDKYL